MIESATAATFSPHLGDRFRAQVGDASLDLELIDVTAAGPAATRAASSRGSRAPFSIVFRGPERLPLSQGIYALDHPTLGRLEIFLVPIAPDAVGRCYEAVFN